MAFFDFERLVELLHHPGAHTRGQAAIRLGELGDQRAVEPLIELLHDPHSWPRNAAASALAQLGDSRAIKPIVECLVDPDRPDEPDIDGDVSWDIPRALRTFGALAVQELIPHMKKNHVIWTLGFIADSSAVQPLIDAYPDLRNSWSTPILHALGEIGDERAIPFLESLLQNVPNAAYARSILEIIDQILHGDKSYSAY